ncbi:unnamed protein product [Parnassius mnemosyne]|uniref:Reverse transcriptase domain-containing protein n=1 Tax=Parnassius mnemosyne TaxID=213953 RepID=A0AAV1LXS7_9NEOP
MTSDSVVSCRDKVVRLTSNKPKTYTNYQIDSNKVNTDIPPEFRSRLMDLLSEYSSSFSSGVPKSRVTTGELQIRLIDPSRTVKRRPYRLSANEREVVTAKVRELEEAGIIKPSCSPFSSPVLLVKKKDDSDRMCVDYRELNDNIVSDRFLLPLIEDLVSRLGGVTWFTCLDMLSGYHQIPVQPESDRAHCIRHT